MQSFNRPLSPIRNSDFPDLIAGKFMLLLAELMPGEEQVENLLSALRGSLMAEHIKRIHARRRLRNGGKKCYFGPAEVLNGFVKIAARRIRDSMDPISVGNDLQIVTQHRFPAIAPGQE